MEEVIDKIFYMYGRAYSYVQPWFLENEYDKVLDYLYISNYASACNKASMKAAGITHVITLIPGVPPMFPDDFCYLVVEVRDRPHIQISEQFQRCTDFIKEAKKSGGKVLVHCLKGISRSATIVCAYLITEVKQTPSQALAYVKARRAVVNPNIGFCDQLNTLYVRSRGMKRRRASV